MLVTSKRAACAECKRRKRKCNGGIPCEWCLSNNITCSPNNNNIQINYNKKIKLTDSKNEICFNNTSAIALSSFAQALGVDYELSKYFDLFTYNVPITMLAGVDWNKLENPVNPTQQFTKFVMCAMTARAVGNFQQSNTLINDAQRFWTTLTEEESVTCITGLILMCVYWLGIDVELTKRYADIANGMFKKLSRTKSVPPLISATLQLYQYIMRTPPDVCDTNTRISNYLNGTKNLILPDRYSEFIITQLRLATKLFAHSKANQIISTRSDILAILDCHIKFTDTQRDDVLAEIAACRSLCPERRGRKRDFFAIDMFEMLLHWKTGKANVALATAIEFAEIADVNSFLLGTHMEIHHLFIVLMILYENQQYTHAQKLFDIASLVHSRIRVLLPLSSCTDILSNFIVDSINNSPFRSPSDLPANPSSISSMVNNILSLASAFLSSGPDSLLSPRGMQIVLKSLETICPPASSNYQLFPLANISSDFTFSPLSFYSISNLNTPTQSSNHLIQNTTPIITELSSPSLSPISISPLLPSPVVPDQLSLSSELSKLEFPWQEQ